MCSVVLQVRERDCLSSRSRCASATGRRVYLWRYGWTGRERGTAFHCDSAATPPETGAFACGAAATVPKTDAFACVTAVVRWTGTQVTLPFLLPFRCLSLTNHCLFAVFP